MCFLAVLVLIALIPSYPTGKNEGDSINFQPQGWVVFPPYIKLNCVRPKFPNPLRMLLKRYQIRDLWVWLKSFAPLRGTNS